MNVGDRLGSYEIRGQLGAGGMGEVYRGHDAKLGRDVAIKVLPTAFAADPERLARMKREAQMLAALNHPNVAAIYGLEEDAGAPYLVMELVEGRSLDEILAAGPIALDEAIPLLGQIAAGVEAAHEQGVIHRDLKPANVRVTPVGDAKVLDFGLAKGGEMASVSGSAPDMTASPTMMAGSTAGVILGTAAYMSPEQARGRLVDRRTDIWSFGCLAYEVLTGNRLFQGEDFSEILAALMRDEPDLDALPADTPPGLRHLLGRCLERDPTLRLRDIGEVRAAIATGFATMPAPAPREDKTAVRPSAAARVVPWIVTAALATALAMNWFAREVTPVEDVSIPVRMELVPERVMVGREAMPMISPDGRHVAYADGETIWVRSLDALGAHRLDVEGSALQLFWSPDSEWIGFTMNEQLYKVSRSGGQPSLISSQAFVGLAGGAAWLADGRIVFAAGDRNLQVVSSAGGSPEPFLGVDPATESDFHEVSALPDGRGVVFVVHRHPQGPRRIDAIVDGERVTVADFDASVFLPRYSPTGHIIFQRRAGTAGIWAIEFSMDSRSASGEPFLVAAAGGFPSVSRDGTLVYVSDAGDPTSMLGVMDRDGEVDRIVLDEQREPAAPRLSPDGNTLAFVAAGPGTSEVYTVPVSGGTPLRITFDNAAVTQPEWLPDGSELFYGLAADSEVIRRIPADGSGEAATVVDGIFPAFSPDGRYLAFGTRAGGQLHDLWYLDLTEPEPDPASLVQTPASDADPQFSPDGRFVAYTGTETGQWEVHLTPFPTGAPRWQVSSGGVSDSSTIMRWARESNEIFYLDNDNNTLMVAEIELTDPPRISRGRELFTDFRIGWTLGFDVSPDGEEIFVVIHSLDPVGAHRVAVIQDWYRDFAEGR